MGKFLRMIFALPFLIAVVSSLIDLWIPSKVVPLTRARVQIHSIHGVSPTNPVSREDSSYVAENHLPERFVRASKEKFPCESLHVTVIGAACDGSRLDFPEVKLNDVLEEDRHLPRESRFISISEKIVGDAVYRNLVIALRWEPATPEFLQIYLKEYLPYWGDRIPYRLFWNAQYDICKERCSTFSESGEYLPADIDGLSPSLAADVNFNGVPAAFWNMNVNP